MLSRTALVPVLFASLVGCNIQLVGDLEIDWDIDGSQASALCAAYGIDYWVISVDGRDSYDSGRIPCSSSWTRVISLAEGAYDVVVSAYDRNDQLIAHKAPSGVVQVYSDRVNPAQARVHFTSTDLKGGGQDKVLNVYWNINGTVDGLSKGQSWDTCAEVGALTAELEVDGKVTKQDCNAGGNMAASVFVTGQPVSVRVRLLDAAGKDLTTWSPTAPGPSAVAGKANEWEYVAEFLFSSFFDPLRKTTVGDYLFTTRYESKSCAMATPQVANQTTLMKLNGTAVTATVCGPDATCRATNGTDFGKCYTPSEVQRIKQVTWGSYKLRLQGVISTTDVCWEKEFDILVGAGTTNPQVDHDLTRISTSGACAL